MNILVFYWVEYFEGKDINDVVKIVLNILRKYGYWNVFFKLIKINEIYMYIKKYLYSFDLNKNICKVILEFDRIV